MTWPPSIRWLLLGVATTSWLLPLAALWGLRRFDAVLVRQTERELNVQGALVAAQFQQLRARVVGRPAGSPRAPGKETQSFTPRGAQIRDLSEIAAPVPERLPTRVEPAPKEYQELSRTLGAAQVFNLSGVRVLDEKGCALASSRALGECYADLPEVAEALSGRPRSVLRERISDERPPALSSLSRRGDIRVFVALPVFDAGQLVGAVWLSRTAETGLQWLFKERRDFFYGGLIVLTLALVVSFGFSRLITRPLEHMRRLLSREAGEPLRLSDVAAPAEIRTLGAALDERAAQLEEKSRYIEEFAANLTHELKTPLTSIRGAAELLQSGAEKMAPEQRARFIANIDAAAARTDRLVSRLMQLAQLEARPGSDRDEAVSVDDWLASLPERYGDVVRVTSKVGHDVRLGLAALESIVINLVDNALRYRRDAPVSVECETQGDELFISVCDDGPGISAENQRRLFERFFTTERDQGGTGLGLPIVLATARGRGGDAQVHSGPGGTRVRVRVRLDGKGP